jgi:hypothetical protein
MALSKSALNELLGVHCVPAATWMQPQRPSVKTSKLVLERHAAEGECQCRTSPRSAR